MQVAGWRDGEGGLASERITVDERSQAQVIR